MGTISVSLPADGTTAEVADYNTPITTIVNEFNGNIDNSNLAAAAAIAGSKIADGAITPNKLSTGATVAYVVTSETTTSTSYVDLTTTTDTVTVTVGSNGLLAVFISAAMQNNTANAFCCTSFALSGANTLAAADENGVIYQSYTSNSYSKLGNSVLLSGLSSGSTTVKMKYRVITGGSGSGTGTVSLRKISAIPL